MKRLLALAAVGILGACASGTDRSELLSDWVPPAEQSCGIVSEPEILPAASDLVDPVELEGKVAQAIEEPIGYALFSLIHDSESTWNRVAVIESDLSNQDQVRLTEALKSELKPPPHPLLRMRLELGDSLEIAVGRQESCAPALRNRDTINRRLVTIGSHYSIQANLFARVWVNTDGSPGEVEIVQGSGDGRVDRDVRSLLRQARFHPALNDRVPVPVWVELPVAVGGGG